MDCPQCNAKYFCPCSACKPRHKQSTWAFEGIGIKCLTCGFFESVDWWNDQAYEHALKKHNASLLSEITDP